MLMQLQEWPKSNCFPGQSECCGCTISRHNESNSGSLSASRFYCLALTGSNNFCVLRCRSQFFRGKGLNTLATLTKPSLPFRTTGSTSNSRILSSMWVQVTTINTLNRTDKNLRWRLRCVVRDVVAALMSLSCAVVDFPVPPYNFYKHIILLKMQINHVCYIQSTHKVDLIIFQPGWHEFICTGVIPHEWPVLWSLGRGGLMWHLGARGPASAGTDDH